MTDLAKPRASALPRLLCASMLLCIALLTAGCSSLFGAAPPAQYEQTNLEIAIEATSGLNPDDKGRAAPILLKVYELRSEGAFQEADFFSLQNADKATLTGDILMVDQFILRPGETRSIRRKSHPEAKAIGIFAGYRDLPNATWRAVYRVPQAPEITWYRALVPNNKISLMVALQPNAVLLTDRLIGKGALGVNEQAGAPMQPQGQTQVETRAPAQRPQPTTPGSGVMQQIDSVRKTGGEVMNTMSSMPDASAVQNGIKDPFGAAKQIFAPK